MISLEFAHTYNYSASKARTGKNILSWGEIVPSNKSFINTVSDSQSAHLQVKLLIGLSSNDKNGGQKP